MIGVKWELIGEKRKYFKHISRSHNKPFYFHLSYNRGILLYIFNLFIELYHNPSFLFNVKKSKAVNWVLLSTKDTHITTRNFELLANKHKSYCTVWIKLTWWDLNFKWMKRNFIIIWKDLYPICSAQRPHCRIYPRVLTYRPICVL